MIKFSIVLLLLISCQTSCDFENGREKDFPDFISKPSGAAEDLEPFSNLIGNWDCASEDLVDSVWYKNKALWSWEYVLGGHAILNHWWQEDNSLNAPSAEYFANGIFIRNKETNEWEAVVMNSRPHKLSPKFKFEIEKDEIKMHDGSGSWHVIFFDISENSFEWKYEVFTSKQEWVPISRISAKRRGL